jgi:hypothetical protein
MNRMIVWLSFWRPCKRYFSFFLLLVFSLAERKNQQQMQR